MHRATIGVLRERDSSLVLPCQSALNAIEEQSTNSRQGLVDGINGSAYFDGCRFRRGAGRESPRQKIAIARAELLDAIRQRFASRVEQQHALRSDRRFRHAIQKRLTETHAGALASLVEIEDLEVGDPATPR